MHALVHTSTSWHDHTDGNLSARALAVTRVQVNPHCEAFARIMRALLTHDMVLAGYIIPAELTF